MKYLLVFLGLALAIAVGYKWYQPRFVAGETAPDLQVTLDDGAMAKLSGLRGNYVILQFWGSWCGPCRTENKHLVRIYDQYKDKGLEMFSIGIEGSAAAWKLAIHHDKLLWRHHSMEPIDFNGNAAQLYNIKSIPATFLLNPEGVIMGVNLRGEQLDKMLLEKLGKAN
jgi:thiol-disulfide isomerase/thioredoxin